MSKFSFVIFAILLLAVTIPGQCESDQSNEIRDYDITVNSLDNGKYKIGLKNNLLLSEPKVYFDGTAIDESTTSGPAWKEFEVDELPARVIMSGDGMEWYKDLVDYAPWAYNQNYKVKDYVILDNGGSEIGLKVKVEYPSELKAHEKGTLDIKAITKDFGYATAPDWQSNIQTFAIIRILGDETLREESDYISGFNDKGMYASPVTVGIAAKPLQPFNYWFEYDSLYQDIKSDHPEYIVTDDLFEAMTMVTGELPINEGGEGPTVGATGALFKAVELALGVTTGIDLSSAFATWQTEYTIGNAPSEDFSDENDHDCWTYIFGFNVNENLCMGANGIHLNYPFSFDEEADHEIKIHFDAMFEGDIPSLGVKGGRIGKEIPIYIALSHEIAWSKTFGGFEDEEGSAQKTSDGGYIIAGSTESYGVGGKDIWLIKTDSEGNKVWDKTFGGPHLDVACSAQETSDGGYIIAGSTESYGAGNPDVWLIKTDSEGNKVWDKTFGGSGWDDSNSAQETSDGGYIIAGVTSSYGVGDGDVWLIKTDSEGNKVWDKTFGGTDYDVAYSVQETDDDGYIIAGVTSPYDVKFKQNVWLIKTNSRGDMVWDKMFSGLINSDAMSVQETNDGGYIVAGHTESNGPDEYGSWLIKTDSLGNEIWNRTFGRSEMWFALSVQQILDGGYIMAGITTPSSDSDVDGCLIKTDSEGNMIWKKTFGGPEWDMIASIEEIGDGEYIMSGFTESYGTGGNDIWLIKI